MKSPGTISKREFIKTTVLGGCGLCLGGLVNGAWGNVRADWSFGNQRLPLLTNPSATPQDKPWKWATESLYFIETPKGIKCKLCPQKCEIEVGKEGKCHSNVNINGKLWNISYGNPCAVHIDPIEKKPLFHYLPGITAYSIATAGCNLACLNCQNWEISQASPKDTHNYDLMPDAVVAEAKKAGCRSIAYTYSDPVAFYEYTLDTSILAKQAGIRNVLVSAGYINPDPLRRLCQSIDAAQIDIKSFSDELYEMLNGGTLQPVLDALKILKEEGVWLEISNLVVPTWTDDPGMIREMCEWMVDNGFQGYPLHFLRFHPMHKLTHLPPTPVSTLDKAREIALAAGMKYVYIGNVPGSQAVNTFCPKCGKLLIERQGYSILQNNISSSKCKFCQEKIDGIWA